MGLMRWVTTRERGQISNFCKFRNADRFIGLRNEKSALFKIFGTPVPLKRSGSFQCRRISVCSSNQYPTPIYACPLGAIASTRLGKAARQSQVYTKHEGFRKPETFMIKLMSMTSLGVAGCRTLQLLHQAALGELNSCLELRRLLRGILWEKSHPPVAIATAAAGS